MSKSFYVSSRKSLSSFNAFVLVFRKGFLHCVKRHAISTLVWSLCSHSLVCLILIVIIFRICFRISLNCWSKKPFAIHCVKSVQIRSYFWSVFSCIRTEYGPEKTPYLDTFNAVIFYGMLIKMFLLLAYDYHIFPEQLHLHSYLFYITNYGTFLENLVIYESIEILSSKLPWKR